MTTPQNKTDSLSLFFRSTIFSAFIFIPTVLRKLDYNRWEKKRKRNKSRSVQMQLTSFILFQIFSWYWACLLTVVVRVISLFIFYALPPIGDKDCILSFWRFTLFFWPASLLLPVILKQYSKCQQNKNETGSLHSNIKYAR